MAATTKNDFIEELKAMKERMEDIFFRSVAMGGQDKESEPERSEDWMPMADILDAGTELVYTLDLPGVPEENLEVECKAERLWISGFRADAPDHGEHIHMERPHGRFSRVFKFPCRVDENGIRAEFKKGVLRVIVPKAPQTSRSQRIFVREVD